MRGFESVSSTLAILALAGCAAIPAQHGPDLNDATLIARLQHGGYVIFMRHAKTIWSQPDSSSDLADCSTQRNLSDEGRVQARDIGTALERLRVPVGEVLTSPYCRTYDTGILAFRRARRVDDLAGVQSAPPEVRIRRSAALRALFAAAPEAGTNTVVIAHMYNLKSVVEILIGEGDAAVIEPRGEEGFRVLGTVSAKRWTELASR